MTGVAVTVGLRFARKHRGAFQTGGLVPEEVRALLTEAVGRQVYNPGPVGEIDMDARSRCIALQSQAGHAVGIVRHGPHRLAHDVGDDLLKSRQGKRTVRIAPRICRPLRPGRIGEGQQRRTDAVRVGEEIVYDILSQMHGCTVLPRVRRHKQAGCARRGGNRDRARAS